ncbi:MAG: hypothetical protein K6E34_12265 [Lachnospiraceae bacterium]|nr:hypothetical protein [Lachnospiraceae bacterium]
MKIINRWRSIIKNSKRKKGTGVSSFKQVSEDCFVLIHIGDKPVPGYAVDAIEQIRLFGNEQIIFICERKSRADQTGIEDMADIVCIEDIPVSKKHYEYIRKMAMEGFVQYTTERFFFLEEAMEFLGLRNVVHIENDVLVYGNVHDIYRKLSTDSGRIILTRHNNDECIGGMIYVPNVGAIGRYTDFLCSNYLGVYINDMRSLSEFAKRNPVDYAPVITKGYYEQYGLKSVEGNEYDNTYPAEAFYNEDIKPLFDAAALGQYIGGIDKIHDKRDTRGYINTNCLYNPSRMKIFWKRVPEGYAPFITDNNTDHPVMNLHIHSKELNRYRSDRIQVNKT